MITGPANFVCYFSSITLFIYLLTFSKNNFLNNVLAKFLLIAGG